MKTSACLSVLISFTLLLSSCIYSDEGEHYVIPVPGEPPVFSAQTNLDTFGIIETSGQVMVRYTAQIENGILYQVTGEVDETEAYDSLLYLEANVGSGAKIISDSFIIQKDVELLPGENVLSLYFYYSTNSNTLADLVGVESNITELFYFIYLEEAQ